MRRGESAQWATVVRSLVKFIVRDPYVACDLLGHRERHGRRLSQEADSADGRLANIDMLLLVGHKNAPVLDEARSDGLRRSLRQAWQSHYDVEVEPNEELAGVVTAKVHAALGVRLVALQLWNIGSRVREHVGDLGARVSANFVFEDGDTGGERAGRGQCEAEATRCHATASSCPCPAKRYILGAAAGVLVVQGSSVFRSTGGWSASRSLLNKSGG